MGKHSDATALLQHTRTLFDDLSQSAQKLSKTFPDLNNLVSAMNALLPKPFADNVEASGGDVLSMLKTALITVSITVVLYWVGYYFVAELARAGTKGLAQFFTYVLPFYPPYIRKTSTQGIYMICGAQPYYLQLFLLLQLFILNTREKNNKLPENNPSIATNTTNTHD